MLSTLLVSLYILPQYSREIKRCCFACFACSFKNTFNTPEKILFHVGGSSLYFISCIKIPMWVT